MKALLHTVLRRYFRSKINILVLIAMPVLGIISGMVAFEVLNTQEMYFHADPYMYLLIAAMFLITAGIVLVIGSAFTDGIIRLQCIHGNPKAQIALAHIISALLWSAVCGILFLLPVRIFGNAYFAAHLTGRMMQVIPPLLMMFPVWSVLIAVLTLNIRHKAISSIVCIALLLGLFIGCMRVNFQLDEPKYRTDFTTEYKYSDPKARADVETKIVYLPNEWYIPKPARNYIEFAYLCDPLTPVPEVGSFLANSADDYQSADQFNKEIRSIHRARRKFLPVFQCFTILALSAAGTWLFRRRNLS